MSQHARYLIGMGVLLVIISAVFYDLQILIFHSPRDTFFYLFQDLAFVPVQVLIVTLIIDRLLSVREKKAMLEKMNMAIGVFFSEVGAELLRFSYARALDGSHLKALSGIKNWTDAEFRKAPAWAARMELKLSGRRMDLPALKDLLIKKKEFMLGFLQNPNLLEHDSFTDLLRAVFHLYEELSAREDLLVLSDTDARHLEGDIRRVYSLLIAEWLVYMRYLKKNYPYLFSIAARQNPFDPGASVSVAE